MPHTDAVKWLGLAVALAGCGSNAEPPDALPADAAAGPFHYTLEVGWGDPQGVPSLDPHPVIFINGQARQRVDDDFLNAATAIGRSYFMELRYGDVVLRRTWTTLGACLTQEPLVTEAMEGWSAYTSGDFRGGGIQAQGPSAACIGDGFALPECEPFGAFPACTNHPYGSRCTSIYTSTSPIATHLGCSPPGTRVIGDSCALIVDVAGPHDDCIDGALCVQGTCKRTCKPDVTSWPGCTSACSRLLGHAPELGVCD